MERESNPMQAMCRSGCGFYGNPATEGLCSKCFKETLKKKQQPPNPPPTSSPSASVAAAAAAAAALSFQQGAGGVGVNTATGAFLGGSPGAAAHGGTPFPLLVQAAAASPRSTRVPLANAAADFLKDIGADEGDLGRINREMRKVHDGWVDLKEGGAEASDVDGVVVAGASGEGKSVAAPAVAAAAAAAASSLDGDKTPPDTPEKNAIAKKKKTRCISCRKKLGLTGFECRCGGLYCAVHRYSDKHSCTFDYREMGAQEIRRNNPVVVGEKIQKI